jgi:hypothetical protein
MYVFKNNKLKSIMKTLIHPFIMFSALLKRFFPLKTVGIIMGVLVLLSTQLTGTVLADISSAQQNIYKEGIDYYDVSTGCSSSSTTDVSLTLAAGSGSPTGGTFPSLDPTSMANAINQYVKKHYPTSPLAGLGDTIVASAKNSNVNPFLIPAIALQETSLGTVNTQQVTVAHNIFDREASSNQPNVSINGKLWYKWSSVKASVDYTATENQNAGGGGDIFAYLRSEYASSLNNGDYTSFFNTYDPGFSAYASNVKSMINEMVSDAGSSPSSSGSGSGSATPAASTTTTTTMYDSTDPSTIPKNAQAVASYIDNGPPGQPPGYQLAKTAFPNATIVSINETSGNNNPADIWGIEPGSGKTVQSTAAAIESGSVHGVYGLQSDLNAVKNILDAKNVPRTSYVLWLEAAGTEGFTTIPSGDDAHQYEVTGSYDVSTISSSFLSTATGNPSSSGTSDSTAASDSTCCPPGSTTGETTSDTTLTGNDNVSKSYNFFIQQGLSPAQAAGVVASELWETGGGVQIDPSTNVSGCFGIVCWESGPGEFDGDKNHNNVTGSDTDLSTQLQVLWDEMNGKSVEGWSDWAQKINAYKQITDPGAAATYFRTYWEKCSDTNASCTTDRVNSAEQVFKQYGAGSGGSGAVADSTGTSCDDTGTTDISDYKNPLRAIMATGNLTPEREDQGVDYGITGGSGLVYALGTGKIVDNESGGLTNTGWDYGGYDAFIVEHLTAGPAAGKNVYVAEDCVPVSGLSVGDSVTADTPLCHITVPDGSGIETGWAEASAGTAESQMPEAGSISGGSACINFDIPTLIGLNYNSLLVALGAKSGLHESPGSCGQLPSGWPTNWGGSGTSGDLSV